MKHLIRWYMNLRIAFKVVVCCLLVFVLFFSLSMSSLWYLVNATSKTVRQISSETTKSVSNNLDFQFATLNNQSIVILSSQMVQNALTRGNPGNSYTFQKQVTNYFADSMNFNDMISSIYVFDLEGDEYYTDNFFVKGITLAAIKKAPWYREMLAKKGQYLLRLNGGGTFSASGSYVSMIRVINSLETQKPIGYMVVNVSTDYIARSIAQENGAYSMQVDLRDESGRTIIAPEKPLGHLADGVPDPQGSLIRKVGGEDYIVSSMENEFGWKITCITPVHELTRQSGTYVVVLILFVLFFGLLLVAAFLFVSIFISNPIHKLAMSMKRVESGDLHEIQLKTGRDEIGQLKDVYNSMVRRIRVLIENIIKEQSLKRRKELEALQAEIKPHFLYNSFDAISGLTLAGENEQAYNLIVALGTFYKSFLNSGNEESTVEKELVIVDNYLTIQQFRFGDKFTVRREIDKRTFGYTLPRLTLQPLVENAINHGIRCRRGKGTLTIRAALLENRVLLEVEDDGAGIPARRLEEIRGGRSEGIGLKTTIERINLYFNASGLVEVRSTEGQGTKISITLPIAIP